MAEEKNEINDLAARVKAFEAEFMPLLKKYDLKLIPEPDFPQYRILPPEIQLAITVIKNAGVVYQFTYSGVESK